LSYVKQMNVIKSQSKVLKALQFISIACAGIGTKKLSRYLNYDKQDTNPSLKVERSVGNLDPIQSKN